MTGVSLSGLAWFVLRDIVTGDFSGVAHLLLTLHGISSYALLVAVGSLLPLHVRAGCSAYLRTRPQSSAIAVPAAALKPTTTSGGARHATSRTKPTSAMPKSRGECTVVVQTGL